MNNLSKNYRLFLAGIDYFTLKSKIIKRNNLNENLLYLTDISKMNLKERLDYKKEQEEINSNNTLYEDIYEFLKSIEIKKDDNKKLEKSIDKLYNEIVINDINDIIINNILNNKDIYSALIIVKKDRFHNLYEKLVEQIKF
jgi:hypothetical protein